MLDRVRDIVGTVAPSLATALGTPLAGMAVRKMADVFDVPPDRVQEIEDRLASPSVEEMEALKRLEGEFRAEMARIGVEIEKIAAEDRADARDREEETGDRTPAMLACVIIGAVMLFNGALYVVTPPAQNMALIESNTSLMEYLVIGIAAYYYGSSTGSKFKDGKIARGLMSTLPSAPARPAPIASSKFARPGGLAVRETEERS